eukprot:jgi/Orpsp1_1/1177142/evm.model.c7180000060346.1
MIFLFLMNFLKLSLMSLNHPKTPFPVLSQKPTIPIVPIIVMGITDSSEVSALKMKEDALILKKLEIYKKYLGIDLHADQKKLITLIENTTKIQSKLGPCNDKL